MDGLFLTYDSEGGLRRLALPKDPCSIGSDAGDAVRLAGPGVQPAHAGTRWVAARATWELRAERESAPVWVDGRLLPPGSTTPLLSGVEVTLGGLKMRFQKIPAAPLLGGQPVEAVALDQQPLVLGRPPAPAEDGTRRVELDPDDSGISRVHALIEWKDGRHWVDDRSRAGMELNGQGAFGRRALVVGDRMRIRDYFFEYDGTSVCRVDARSGASIMAEGVGVSVPRRDGGAGLHPILKEISVHIRSGEFVGILGGSGQGKTTLLHVLCGLLAPTEGTIRFNGQPLHQPGAVDPAVGYVPQDDLVHPELTVEEAITAAARLRLKATPAQIQTLVRGTLQRLGLTDHARKRIGSEISGGQRKRVSIATELLTRPDVLLLDEPSSGLDPFSEEELMSFLQSLRNTGQTVICTTHILNRAYLFDRILFVHAGRLIFAGTPQEARAHFLDDDETSTQTAQRAPLERIYREVQLTAASSGIWEQRFRESPFARDLHGHAPPVQATVPPRGPARRNGFPDIVRTLLHRQWRLLRGDRMNAVFLIGQAAGIGILTAVAAENPGLRLFLLIIATLWFGCSNAAQQIVSESAIYRRERVCGVGRHSYILSKFLFFSAVTLAQSVLLYLCVGLLGRLLHGAVPEDAGMPFAAWLLRCGALALAALAGTGMGLAVSALARSATQAVLLVPLLMIPQVLLGGYVITRPEMNAGTRAFAALWPSYQAQRIADVSSTLGRPVPLMSGNTKIPIFLQMRPESASGEASAGFEKPAQDPVTADPDAWQDPKPEPGKIYRFERLSDYSAAWRNLLVRTDAKGQAEPKDTAVAARNDVRLTAPDWRGKAAREIYLDTAPARLAAVVLLVHCAAFYVLVTVGLRRREMRK